MEETTNTPIITVDKVSKIFKLPHEKNTSLKSAIIKFKTKTKFEEQKALKDVDFEINKGEFFGIVGRNGSGKSTLLKMLAGIYPPTKGKITVRGKLTPFIELGVGFNPELTGRENVFLNGALLGFNRKEMLELYDDIVEFAELERFMDQKLKNYSSGMQVRLAFSIAIRAKSDILLIDEVLAVGDALFQKKCFEYFSKLKEEKRTVVFVSHDSEALLRFCEKGILIDNGKVKEIGNIETVVRKYRDLLMEQDLSLAAHAAQPKQSNTKKTKTKQNNTPAAKPVEKKPEKPVVIKAVRTRNEQKQTKTFKFEESVQVEIDVDVRHKVKVLNVAIGIYNGVYEAHADRVFGANTLLEKHKLPTKSQKISLTVDKPLLREGEYVVYVSVFGESEDIPYDYKLEAAKFTVEGSPNYNSVGVILANHDWRS